MISHYSLSCKSNLGNIERQNGAPVGAESERCHGARWGRGEPVLNEARVVTDRTEAGNRAASWTDSEKTYKETQRPEREILGPRPPRTAFLVTVSVYETRVLRASL